MKIGKRAKGKNLYKTQTGGSRGQALWGHLYTNKYRSRNKHQDLWYTLSAPFQTDTQICITCLYGDKVLQYNTQRGRVSKPHNISLDSYIT